MGNFLTNQIMYWGTDKVSDHGRSPLEVSYDRIERKNRMVKGTLRKYVVTQKRSWSCSWDNLPTLKAEVVDNGMTGPEMEAFVTANPGPFVVTFRDGQGNQTTATVMIEDFSKEIIKRGTANDFWNASVTLEEV